MRATGMVRRMDELGRIVIPKEIRRTLHMREGEALEIFTEQEGQIILRKYSPLGEVNGQVQMIVDSLAQASGYTVCVSDTERIIATAGNGKGMFAEKFITDILLKTLQQRKPFIAKRGEKNYIPIVEAQKKLFISQLIYPIICEGDLAGGIILLTKESDKKIEEGEVKMTSYAATLLGKQLA